MRETIRSVKENRYKIVIAILFGFAGFWVNFFPITFPLTSNFDLSFLLGLCFPIVVSLAYGWPYGLLSAIFGGAQTMWFLWPSSGGWVAVIDIPFFTLWIVWHGFWADQRGKGFSRFRDIYTVEIVFRLMKTAVLFTIWRWIVVFNPPFWAPDAVQQIMPLDIVGFIAVKQIVNGFVILLIADVLLNIGLVRRLLRLKITETQTSTNYILSASILIGLLFWICDGMVDYFTFNRGQSSLIESLFIDISVYELYMRTTVIIACVAAGLVSAKFLQRQYRSESQFKSLFNSVGDAIFIHDMKGKILEVNQETCDRYGYSREQLKQMAANQIDTPEQAIFIPARTQELLEKGRLDFETVHRNHNGKEILTEVTARITEHQAQQVVLSICKDITERKRAEEFIQRILETVEEGFVVIDHDYRILLANKAYSQHVQIPLDAIQGRHCYDISHHLDMPCYEAGEDCPVKHSFETGEPHAVTHLHRDRAGHSVYEEIKSYPMKDASGKVISVIETLNDITEKVRLEDQLLHAQKMEAIGRLAGGIAHDFNNVLTSILGYSELVLLKLPEDHQAREDIDIIRDSGQRAAALTRQLLAFSRKQVLEIKAVNLNGIVENLGKMLQRMIGEDITLELKTEFPVVNVMADPGQIEQILMNLSVNAKDAMPGGGRLTLETACVDLDEEYARFYEGVKTGLYVMLSMTDTGTGMSKEVQKKIFEPFFTTKEVSKGTGLGLSTVYGIVKQHKGHMFVYSEEGEGTTFKIFFPATEEEEKVEFSKNQTTMPRGSETILVVEDEASIRSLIVDSLQPLGYTIIGAANGEEALTVCDMKTGGIDLLITDMIMPGMSGSELAEAFAEKRPDTKILFVSGYSHSWNTSIKILGKETTFMQKPLIPGRLVQKVRDVLDEMDEAV